MKKLLPLLLLILFGSAPKLLAQAVQVTAQMNVSATTTGTGVAVPTTYYHQVSWSVIGNPATCSFTIDSSPDNSSWTTGGAVPAQTCTSGGQSAIFNAAVGYIRINLSTFTGSGSIKISYTGYSSGVSSSVTSGTGAPSGACTNGSLYTNISNGTVYSCNAGTWAAIAGGTTISGLTVNVIPRATTGGTNIQNGSLTDNGSGVITGPASNDLNLTAGATDQSVILTPTGSNGVIIAQTANNPLLCLRALASNPCFWASASEVYLNDSTFANPKAFNAGSIGVSGAGQTAWINGTGSIGVLNISQSLGGGATGNLLLNTITPSLYATATNCIANGTAANPSVVTCGSAAAGMFSCATNATTATCQVNTTAVTANSEINITDDAADGGASQLNVTCNTTLTTPAAKPVLLSKSTGASFTINLGTVTANPACFEYSIIN